MKTKAVRLYGENDLRLDEFELPPIKDDEILAKVFSDSICMSTHKLAAQGAKHKRVRHDLSKNQPIVGHVFTAKTISGWMNLNFRQLRTMKYWRKCFPIRSVCPPISWRRRARNTSECATISAKISRLWAMNFAAPSKKQARNGLVNSRWGVSLPSSPR